jgi:hypothetical protein
MNSSFYVSHDTVGCQYSVASVTDKSASMEHRWNDTDEGKPKYREKKLYSVCGKLNL